MITNNFLHNRRIHNYGSLRRRNGNTVTERVTLSEAKAHLRIDSSFTADDTYITTLITVARTICENYVGFNLAEETSLEYYLDDFPDTDVIYLYGIFKPTSVLINYRNTSGVITTLNSSNYEVDLYSIPARIFLKEGSSFPEISDDYPSAITISCGAGPTSDDHLPRPIYHAILLTIGHLYENRQNVIAGVQSYEVPQAAEYLMNPYRYTSV